MKSLDIVIDTLIIEEDRPEHIAKHSVTIDEVQEVIQGDFVYIKGREERLLLIGKTKKERFLTIIVGKRAQKNTYGLITARPARNEEKNFYKEFTLEGGDEDD